MTELFSRIVRPAGIAMAAAFLLAGAAAPAGAQPPDANPGAVTLTTGADVPSVYFFRGIRQEANPEFTLFPYADIGVALFSGDGAVKSASVNVGLWNSLHTGSAGSDGPGGIHYEEDFYSTLTLSFGRGLSVGTTFTAYTSPNGSFTTVKELGFKVAHASRFAPYGLVAFELACAEKIDGACSGGQADGGSELGTYAELGVAPSWPLAGGKLTLAIPVKLGLSLGDYYEGADGDDGFGYIDGGALITVPLTGISSNFGAWNIHGSLNFLGFGDTNKAFNQGDGGQVIVMGGIGMTY